MHRRTLSYLLVLIQFICLGVLALTGPWLARSPLGLALQVVGVAIALWGIASIRIQDLSVFPDVKDGARFVRRGPYRFIRHPMYVGLLLATAGVVIEAPTLLRVGVWLLLLIDIVVKMHHEEGLLSTTFEEYAGYRRSTWRLIPYVY